MSKLKIFILSFDIDNYCFHALYHEKMSVSIEKKITDCSSLFLWDVFIFSCFLLYICCFWKEIRKRRKISENIGKKTKPKKKAKKMTKMKSDEKWWTVMKSDEKWWKHAFPSLSITFHHFSSFFSFLFFSFFSCHYFFSLFIFLLFIFSHFVIFQIYFLF